MDKLENLEFVGVTQQKEWGEILTDFETKNKYSIIDEQGRPLYDVFESGGGLGRLISRLFLKSLRPFQMKVMDGQEVLRINRPFRFYFHQIEIIDGNDKVLGTVKRKFTLLRRKYSVRNNSGQEICELVGPIFHPWTFNIQYNGRKIGKISKEWSGVGKELFTDADNFGVRFPVDLDLEQKKILIGAVFLIDLMHFEK